MIGWNKSFSIIAMVAAVILVAVAVPSVHGDEQASRAERGKVLYSETVDTGLLFVDGKSINAPYEIQATATSLSVNGLVVEPIQFKMFDSDESSEPDQGYGRRRWRARQPETVLQSRFFVHSLKDLRFIVCFSEQPSLVISAADEELFLQTLVNRERPSDQVNDLAALAPTDSAVHVWKRWLNDFQPSSQLRQKLEARLAAIEEQHAHVASLNIAATRSELFSYPLILLGMLLSVVAFGHLMHWTRLGFHGPGENTAEVTRYVVIALLLMFGMASLDLVWTTICTQAGAMTELNPIATLFNGSPVQLAFFKFAATGVSFAIFFIWRSRRQVQQAAWWMCLVCVLLTFRWVVIDSMMY